jgi:isoamylase
VNLNQFRPGKSFPLGATPTADGVNFSLYCKNGTGVQLLLFDSAEDAMPSAVIDLDPKRHRTAHYWHIFLPELKTGQVYAYRVQGPADPQTGHRYDAEKVLLDPYAKCIAAANYQRAAAKRPGDNAASALKCVVTGTRNFDWQGDTPLNRPFSQTVIYELHVGGFTRHPSSGVAQEKRGTYAGVIEKIPHLLNLGITAVELLPVFQFDQQDAPVGLSNYWGYCPISFFAPHMGYSSRRDPLGCLDEFREMVKALHRAGIEVILDVVYNHTAEGPEDGPTLCYRGIDNATYYMTDAYDKSRSANYTGCGNTLNANHSIVRRMILDSVYYWVSTMHVDGFRFDLASILSRDEAGRPLRNAPVLSDLESDPILAGTKLIAEAWDLELYQVGNFASGAWMEWNGVFRDDVRSFVRGDGGTIRQLANRMMGSPDLYGAAGRQTAEQSVNFICCHDGFTLNDLVSYDGKHNETNREENRDGSNNNRSWNCGVEGPSNDPVIEKLRNQQIKNMLAIVLLSTGTPMIMMGDEVRRTQRGNNNAYCQDNALSWLDWSSLEKHADLLRFVNHLVRFRANFERSRETETFSLADLLRQRQIQWHGVKPLQPDWSENSHSLAFSRMGFQGCEQHLILLNAYWEALEFELPSPLTGSAGWLRFVDTSFDSPFDVNEPTRAPLIESPRYTARPRSAVVLICRKPNHTPRSAEPQSALSVG